MSDTKLINLRTGEVYKFRDGDEFNMRSEFTSRENIEINFTMDQMHGPWSLSFDDRILMVFNGAFVPDCGIYRCLSFRRIEVTSQSSAASKLVGNVVAYRPKAASATIMYGDFAQEIGLASVYHDKPTFTVEFAGGGRAVDAEDCVEATKDQQIAYWRQRALNACSPNEDS